VSWDEALDDIAARLKAIAARDPQAIVPYSYAGTMGLVQGESMARASSTGSARRCWTAPSAPAPAARR
jgi:anaerobic selenocysteine-containing dehydrogenase